MKKGVLAGADRKVEWLLPWWWGYFSRYNKLPVAFFDFGMSEEKRAWCQERGEVIEIPAPLVAPKELCSKAHVRRWEKAHSQVWGARKGWFQKPLACLQTPFDISLWIDVDCEVAGPLERIFNYYDPAFDFGIALEPKSERERHYIYNSGVLAFKKGSPALEKWAKICSEKNDRYICDQDALSALIREEIVTIQRFPQTFNWLMYCGVNTEALVHHWSAVWGKEHIQKYGGVHDLLGNR